jgi:hypothetical protein
VRQAINSNPVVQAVLIGLLAVAAGFLLLTRVMGGGASTEAPPTDPAATTVAPTDAAAAPTDATATATPAPDATATPPTDATGAPVPVAPAAPTGGFEAGPGLPKNVVQAYDNGDTVVVLISKRKGIDDQLVRQSAAQLKSRPGTAVFETNTHDVATYSRITNGVDVNRVPALVVLAPKKLSKGGLPSATVSYGFRSPESALQAVKDAEYNGRELPYSPR